MEQRVLVRRVFEDGTAEVVRVRESACSGDCHQCAGCGAARQILVLTAYDRIGAAPGDLVTIQARSGPVLIKAAVLYMLPLCLFFLGYYIAEVLGGCLGFCAGLGLAVLFDRLVARRGPVGYTITGFVKKQ